VDLDVDFDRDVSDVARAEASKPLVHNVMAHPGVGDTPVPPARRMGIEGDVPASERRPAASHLAEFADPEEPPPMRSLRPMSGADSSSLAPVSSRSLRSASLPAGAKVPVLRRRDDSGPASVRWPDGPASAGAVEGARYAPGSSGRSLPPSATEGNGPPGSRLGNELPASWSSADRGALSAPTGPAGEAHVPRRAVQGAPRAAPQLRPVRDSLAPSSESLRSGAMGAPQMQDASIGGRPMPPVRTPPRPPRSAVTGALDVEESEAPMPATSRSPFLKPGA